MISFDQRHVHGTLEMVRQLVGRGYTSNMIANILEISVRRAEALIAEVDRISAKEQ